MVKCMLTTISGDGQATPGSSVRPGKAIANVWWMANAHLTGSMQMLQHSQRRLKRLGSHSRCRLLWGGFGAGQLCNAKPAHGVVHVC
jgi:hypothetical protein